ncbi:MAG: 4Fe-4S dicluster domain-containing protein [Deltaproteobacteria bacterium]|nr:MAG: 4Fe-4S dicluster domain-containing protein [Deltaproteobacteria bacterium]
MEEKALVLHPEKCTGCHACEMICSLVHDGECNLTLSRIGIMKTNGGGSNENIPIVCQQCHDPICADVCVMGAISRNEETGALVVNEDLCVGCKTCVIACPLGGVLYHHIKGCAMKCDLCSGDPECVKSCLYEAIEFLTMDEWGRKTRLKGAENLGRIFEMLCK